MRKTLTDRGVSTLKPRPNRYAFPDPNSPATMSASRRAGRIIRHRHPLAGASSLDHARIARPHHHRDRARDGTRGDRPRPRRLSGDRAQGETFGGVVATGARAMSNATACQRYVIVGVLAAHPSGVGDRELVSIRRSDITALFDQVEDAAARTSRLLPEHPAQRDELARLAQRRLRSAGRRAGCTGNARTRNDAPGF